MFFKRLFVKYQIVLVFALPALASANDFNPYAYFFVVNRYANGMILNARDTYDSEYSPLFASTLDRETLYFPSSLPSIPGVREGDRMRTGSNSQHHQEFFQVLYYLSKITGDPNYALEADSAIEWFFNHCQSPVTDLMAWGEHIGWDFLTENRLRSTHEFFDVWKLWNESYRLSPQPCIDFAMGLWDHQIYDKMTCDFSRHANYDSHGPGTGRQFPRHGGFYIHSWAHAYNESSDPNFKDEMLTAIDRIVDSFENRRPDVWQGDVPPGGLPAGTWSPGTWWPESEMELAVNTYKIAHMLPTWLADKVHAMGSSTDTVILTYIDDFDSTWIQGYGTTATHLYNLYRYDQTGLEGHKTLFMKAADDYLVSEPGISELVFPKAFADAIESMLAAYELTGDEVYFERANYFGQMSLGLFFDDKMLPKVTSKHNHYEAITGADALALQLLLLFEESTYWDCDLNGDVDYNDLLILASNWLSDCNTNNSWCDRSDIDKSGKVDFNDFSIFASHWKETFDFNDFNEPNFPPDFSKYNCGFESPDYVMGDINHQNSWQGPVSDSNRAVEIVEGGNGKPEAPEGSQFLSMYTLNNGDLTNEFLPYAKKNFTEDLGSVSVPFTVSLKMAYGGTEPNSSGSDRPPGTFALYVTNNNIDEWGGAIFGFREFDGDIYISYRDGSLTKPNDFLKMDADPNVVGIQAASPDRFYKYECQIQPANEAYDLSVYFNSTLLDSVDDVLLRHNVSDFETINFWIQPDGYTGSSCFYVDDIKIQLVE
ncbi:MAG: hypothetical protein ACYTBV_13265 [Planctomycetota bacterium]